MNISAKCHQLFVHIWLNRYYFCIPVIMMPLIGALINQSNTKLYYASSDILLQEITLINPTLSDISIPYKLTTRFNSLKTLIQTKDILTDIALKASVITKDMPQWQQFWLLTKIRQSLSISLIGKELVSITLHWEDNNELIKLINQLKQVFIIKLSQPNMSASQSANQFLSFQLKEHASQIKNTQNEINNLMLKQLHLPSYLVISPALLTTEFRDKIRIMTAEINKIKNNRDTILNRLSKIEFGANRFENMITNLQIKRNKLLSIYQDNHSKVRNINQEIDQYNAYYLQHHVDNQKQISQDEHIAKLWQYVDIQRKLHGTARNKPSSLEVQLVELDLINQELNRLNAEFNTLQTQLRQFNDQHQHDLPILNQIKQLSNELAQKDVAYTALQERLEMAKLAQSLNLYQQENSARIVSLPLITYQQKGIPLSGYIALGLFIALLQGCFASFLAYLRNDKIKSVQSISRITKLNIITSLPYIPLK